MKSSPRACRGNIRLNNAIKIFPGFRSVQLQLSAAPASYNFYMNSLTVLRHTPAYPCIYKYTRDLKLGSLLRCIMRRLEFHSCYKLELLFPYLRF